MGDLRSDVLSRKLMVTIGIIGGVLVLAVMAFAIFEPIQVLPRIRLAPGYLLEDQAGAPLTSEDVRGDVVLYSFRPTDCGDACASVDATMAAVHDRIAEAHLGDVSFRQVTIALDPDSATPAAMRAAATDVGADGDAWRIATGEPKHLKNVVGAGFKVWYEERDDGTMGFDPTLILVDGWGVIRGEYEYRTLKSDADKILHHLDLLGREIRNAKGAASLAYGAAHFFLCYP